MKVISISNLKMSGRESYLSFSESGNIRISKGIMQVLYPQYLTSASPVYLHIAEDDNKLYIKIDGNNQNGLKLRIEEHESAIGQCKGLIKMLAGKYDWPLFSDRLKKVRYQLGEASKSDPTFYHIK